MKSINNMIRRIKWAIKRCLSIGKSSVDFLWFLMRMLSKSRLCNPFVRKYSGTVAVLANGPSLKRLLSGLSAERFPDTDFIVMNFMGAVDAFTRIKPKHYCLADPMFFHPNHKEKEVRQLFSMLNERVDWEMNLYIPKDSMKEFKPFSALSNPHIHLVPLNCIEYKGFECLRYFFYKRGLSMPVVATVAIMAIFVGINSGYCRIDLYGVDHTFFDGMCVDKNNRLCNKETHFYDNGDVELKPILRMDNSQIWKIGEYVKAIGQMFISHDLLASYARHRNVRIVNCTECSMIDSYERSIN